MTQPNKCICGAMPNLDCPILRHHREAMEIEDQRGWERDEMAAEMEWDEEERAREYDAQEAEDGA